MTDGQVQTGIGRFENGVGGKRRRDKNGGNGRASLLGGLGDGVEHRHLLAGVFEDLPALAGRDARRDLPYP